VYKTGITDMDKMKNRLLMECAKMDQVIIVADFINDVTNRSRSVMCVF